MTYHVKTAVFEGPLDLLLQLVARRQVEVTEVRLTDLVVEYLEYLAEMGRADLDVTSEFILVAATLIQLKMRQLLPGEEDLEDEIALTEERDRLVARLLQCLTFKDVAAVLSARFQSANRFVPRASDPHPEISPRPADVTLPVDAAGLARIAARVLADRADPDVDHLELDLPSVQAALDELRVRVAEEAETTFERLVAHCRRRLEIAAYFLALLELARWGLVELSQEHWADEIRVRHRQSGSAAVVISEWDR